MEEKKDIFLTIHGHFYQPPRENPWLEAVELQESALPCHDWNERVCAECYTPNSVSRVVDSRNKILDIVNNYEKIIAQVDLKKNIKGQGKKSIFIEK